MKISDVSKAFDIPAETLRFIEQQGLVHPSRNKANGYRDYDLTSFSELVEYMKLRRLGLPIRAILNLSNEHAIDILLQELEKSTHQMQLEIQRKQMLLSFLEEYRRILKNAMHNIGIFSFELEPSMMYVEGGTGQGETYHYNNTLQVTKWRKETPYVSLGCSGDINSLFAHVWSTKWFFITEEKYAKSLALPDGIPQPECLCLTTFVNYLSWDDLIPVCRQMIEFAEAHRYSHQDRLRLIQLARDYQHKNELRYYAKLSMPLQKTL